MNPSLSASFRSRLALAPEISVSPEFGEPTEVERKVIATTLDLVMQDFSPRAAAFSTVDADGGHHVVAARDSHGSHQRLRSEVSGWIAALGGLDPLGPERLAAVRGPVATLADVGVGRPPRRSSLLEAYRRIGAVNEAGMLIREGGHLVAGVTLWRSVDDAAWGTHLRDRLAALQPLVEMAYRKARRVGTSIADRNLLSRLTRRQREVAALLRRGATNREVARALGISESTARSHTRAVLAELGVSSRGEVVLRLGRG